MKIIATLATLVAAATLGAITPTAAQSSDIGQVRFIPPYEVLTIIRSMGFDPAGGPALRGQVYVVRAFDGDDIPVRVAVNARTGQVINVTELPPGGYYGPPPPMRMGAYPVPPGSVPQGSIYREGPDDGAPPPAALHPASAYPPVPTAAAPAVKRPTVVATRTPTPRPRPAAAAPAAPTTPGDVTASIPDASHAPGKSIPAPVAHAAPAPAATSGDASAKKELPPVPVAPLL